MCGQKFNNFIEGQGGGESYWRIALWVLFYRILRFRNDVFVQKLF